MEEEAIDLRWGMPSYDTSKKCLEMLRIATQQKLSDPEAYTLAQYGPNTGSEEFKESLAEFLTQEYKEPVHASALVETAGASHALCVLINLFFATGDVVFMEWLAYNGTILILNSDLRMNTVPVMVDSDGINTSKLEEALQAHSESRKKWVPSEERPFWAVLYVVPTFQNPTGVCLSPARCKRVVELAREHDLLVICDDVYNCLYFPDFFKDGHPPKRLFAYDNRDDVNYKGNVVSVGTFSKIFVPGVRVGWMEAPERVVSAIDNCGMALSGGAFNHMAAGMVVAVLQQGGMASHLQELRTTYQENYRAMACVLREKVPEIEVAELRGGYFLWIRLPDGFPLTGEEFADVCAAQCNVQIADGTKSSSTGGHKNYIRVPFTSYSREVLVNATERIANKLAEIMRK